MRILLFHVLLLWAACCRAQPVATGTPALYQVTEQNGLSDDHVRCVLKDRQGFVWIGTSDGLNVMDGSQLTIFKHREQDTASISNNTVDCLAEDAAGNIWAGTNRGLNRFDPVRHVFTVYAPAEQQYGASNIIKSVVVDDRQRVWCGTPGGLFMFDPQQKTFYPCFNTYDARLTNRVNYLLKDSRGLLWVCTSGGLWSFNTREQRFKKELSSGVLPGEDLWLCAMEDHNGHIWAGSWGNGLQELDPHTGKVKRYLSHPNNVAQVSRILEVKQPDGSYLFWLNGQMLTFKPATGQFAQFPIPLQMAAYPTVNPYYLSNDNWIWLGSDKGLYIYNPQRQLFHHRFFKKMQATQGVNFMEWGRGLLEGGQAEDFLRSYNDNWTVQKEFNSILRGFPPGAGQRSASLLAFQKEDDNHVWVGTSDGLMHLDLATGKNQWYMHRNADSNSLPRNFITHLFIDHRRQLWVFPWREGIWQMDSANGGFRRLWDGFVMDAGRKKKLVISDAVEDSAGNIWMTDLDEGIILYDRASGRFSKPFVKQIGERVNAIRIFYRDGYCYALVERALCKWKPGRDSFRQYPLPPEMSKEVVDMVPDKSGRWWWATRNGLVLFDEPSGDFRRFTIADGLVSNDMSGTLFCRDNGMLLFASDRYITSFDPGELLRSGRTAPAAVVRDIIVNGQRVSYDSSQPLQLDHLSTNLLFHWTVTDYSNPFNNRFYCRLAGIDAGWRDVGNKGEIQYANLSPGTYDLLLKGVTANGVAAKNILPVHFVIRPPFWQAWWFRGLLLALLAFVVYIIFRLRIGTIRKEESVKSAFNRQKAELEMKALRAQMNPHFVFNSLSSIQESIVTGKTEAASKYLSKFSRLIRLILENSGSQFILLKTEIESLTLYLELESFRFENFTYIISIDPAVDAGNIHIPSMVIQPFVENAVKHGFSHLLGDKQLIISICRENGGLVAIVEDNGIGRRRAEALKTGRLTSHHSMGMKITEDRLQLLRLPENEKPVIFITDLEDEKGNAAGTRVKIILPTEE